jgi:hypothetical protein
VPSATVCLTHSALGRPRLRDWQAGWLMSFSRSAGGETMRVDNLHVLVSPARGVHRIQGSTHVALRAAPGASC